MGRGTRAFVTTREAERELSYMPSGIEGTGLPKTPFLIIFDELGQLFPRPFPVGHVYAECEPLAWGFVRLFEGQVELKIR